MIKPVFTEKSLKLAKLGKYSFWVEAGMNKPQIKALINKLLGVHVVTIKTVSSGSEAGRNAKGRKFLKLATKKAIVTLKEKEKIDLFEEGKK